MRHMRWMICLFIFASSASAWAQDAIPSITVSGSAEVTAAPDMAMITLAVTHEAPNAADAMAQVSHNMALVSQRLAGLGIAARDIQTDRVTLNPVWQRRNSAPGERPRITGFVASNAVSVRVRMLDDLGTILDSVIADGATDMSGLRFGLSDPEPFEAQARAEAVANAMTKAKELADAANLILGPVRSLT